MKGGGTGDDGHSEGANIQDSRFPVPLYSGSNLELLVDKNCWLYLVYEGETIPLPQNPLFKSVGLVFVTCAFVYFVSKNLRDIFFRVVSVLDGLFERIYTVGQVTSGFFASERMSIVLDNIRLILRIVLLILGILLVLLAGPADVDVGTVLGWLI